jgi:hypothetical protein
MAAGFVIDPDHCTDCGEPLYDTGCDAPGCNGRCCQNCGTGCDLAWLDADEDGYCATRLARESDTNRTGRVNRERAAVGLSETVAWPDEKYL